MGRRINITRFDQLAKRAENYNSRHSGRRFHMVQSREGSILIFGMYDYDTKQYSLSAPFIDINLIFNEIEEMLNKASA